MNFFLHDSNADTLERMVEEVKKLNVDHGKLKRLYQNGKLSFNSRIFKERYYRKVKFLKQNFDNLNS